MADRILTALSCLLCVGIFFLIGRLCRISSAPVPFFTGSEEKLKREVSDVPGYNQQMGCLFRSYGGAWLGAALLGSIFPPLGIAAAVILCTLGLFLLFRRYRRIHEKYA